MLGEHRAKRRLAIDEREWTQIEVIVVKEIERIVLHAVELTLAQTASEQIAVRSIPIVECHQHAVD